jgi:hypothetical protein
MREDDPSSDDEVADARSTGVIHAVPSPDDGVRDAVESHHTDDTDDTDEADDTDGADDPDSYRDWRWVEQWRAEGAGPAWAPGITLAIFVAVLVAVALLVLTSGLSDTPWLAILVNLVIAAGMAPALWLSRGLPVLRFLAGGGAVGLVAGWIWMLLTFAG